MPIVVMTSIAITAHAICFPLHGEAYQIRKSQFRLRLHVGNCDFRTIHFRDLQAVHSFEPRRPGGSAE